MGELGLLGACIPAEYGGAGADFVAYIAGARGDLARRRGPRRDVRRPRRPPGSCRSSRTARTEQIERLIPPAAQGHELCAFALTKSARAATRRRMLTRADDDTASPARSSGSRTVACPHVQRLRARRRGDQRVPRPARRARVLRHPRGGEARPALLVDRRPGLRRHPGRAPRAPGGGMRIALSTLDGGRIGIAAQAVGIAQAALDVAASYAKERQAFGGPIAGFQAIGHRLADMQTEIEGRRALVLRAAHLKDAGRPHTIEGAQAKLFASRVARHWTGEAIQVLGGYGYTKDSRPSATTATPRSPRSMRARARSSGWSSPTCAPGRVFGVQDSRPMLEGLMQHDHPLTLQHVLRRMRTMNADGGRHPDRGRRRADHVRRPGERVDRLCHACRARRQARRPRRDVLVEHPAPPRALPRGAVPGRGAAHAQHPPVPRAADLHRQPRAGPLPVRRRVAARRARAGRADVRDHRARSCSATSTSSCWPSARRPFDWPELDDRAAAGLCYTSGTTGNPKGVLYSHRSNVLHALGKCLADADGVRHGDRVLPVVPMFHANAWGFPVRVRHDRRRPDLPLAVRRARAARPADRVRAR